MPVGKSRTRRKLRKIRKTLSYARNNGIKKLAWLYLVLHSEMHK